VLLRDPVVTSIDVFLRFTIEGPGIKIYTNPSWKPAPLNIQTGIPVLIPSSTIAECLRPQNIIVEGMSPQELYRGGKLPEGYYQFKVEVFEYNRGVPISNVGRTGVWLLLNEPPRIVFPANNQKVNATNPQFINFSWVPGGIASPLSAQNTMYEFTMVELLGDVDPNIAITTAPDALKFTRTLQQTSLLYGPGEPPLIPGKRYAFRVRAYNTEGYEIFKNNGYSEVRVFQFGDACLPPTMFTLKDETQNSFAIEVVSDPGSTAWQAQFREGDNESAKWSELKPETTNTKTVKGLKASTAYQVQLKSVCGTVSSGFTPPQTITTKQKVNTQRSCDNSVSPFVVQQAQPLKQLKPNNVFLAALIPIKVTEVTKQGGGKFTGKGVASLPLVNAGLAVTFTDIGINELMQLTSGEVVVERNAVNITLFGDNEPVPGGGNGGGSNPDSTGTSPWPEFTDTLTVDSDIDSVVVVNDSTVWVYTSGGTGRIVAHLGGNDCLLIVPADGNMDKAQVVYNGAAQSYRVGSGPDTGSAQTLKGFRVWFTPAMGSQFGYDSLRIKEYSDLYNDLFIDSTLYKLPWKALAAGIPEPVEMHVRRGVDSLAYSALKVLADGKTLTPTTGANTALQTYNLIGTSPGDEYPMLASYSVDDKKAHAGGLWTATYQKKGFTLYVVPLSGTRVTEGTVGLLQNYLNQIYSQALVSWNVQAISGFPGIDLGDNGLDHADNEMLSAYNPEMNRVISAFKDWHGKLNPEAAYLFLVPKADGGLQGYMPFNRQFGFVVVPTDADGNVDAATLARTAAHELGHGIFSLRHTFSTKNFVYLQQGTTDNLMDYSGTTATRLNKYQWDYIHNPQNIWFAWAEEEEEGEMIEIPDIIKQIREANSKGEKMLKIVQDKCQRWAMKNFKLGNGQKLSYIHLSCSDKLEEPFPFDEGYSGNFGWSSIFNSTALNIDPSEISKVNTIGTKDNKKYVRYQFHELKQPDNAIELPSLTDNVLFHFVVLEEEAKDFETYLFPTWEYLMTKSELTPSEIATVRKGIEKLTDINEKKAKYLELQKKVPYHNQRNNNQSQDVADRMCNLTSEAMCLEYLGISCPDSKMQFEDYLEQLRKDNNYGDRTTPIARQKVAEYIGACYQYKEFKGSFSDNKEKIKDILLPRLESGCAIMLSVWPICKGHLVRLQNVTDDGLIVDDPYGKVKGKVDGFDWREACNSGGYDTNSTAFEDNKGNDNLWKWSDIKDVTLKYVEIYCKCE